MVDKKYKELSIRKQAQLLSLNRSSLYLNDKIKDDSLLCNAIAEVYSDYPIYGYRRITAVLRRGGYVINHKLVQRLMKEMNLHAIYPGPNTSKRNLNEMKYPYLLSNLAVTRVNMVWQVDITYLRTKAGFMYLVAYIDVYSRLIVGFQLSNSLCVDACVGALKDAILKHDKPDIINSDQGSQFTSNEWIEELKVHGVTVSMTGKGRCRDNAHIERLWKSFKYEGSYLYKWNSIQELKNNIPKWVDWYNYSRPHQALKYKTPFEKYYGIIDKYYNLSTIPQYIMKLRPNFMMT